MAPRLTLRALPWLAAGLLTIACGDGDGGSGGKKDGGGERDARVEADASDEADGGADAGDASSGELTPCLDQPNDLARPPTGRLPCDMLPPSGIKR